MTDQIQTFTLENNGRTAVFIDYGATLTRFLTPDRNGKLDDIVLGFDKADDYVTTESRVGNSQYFNVIAGRYANRIAKGRFTLHGVEYQLACNNGVNHLHGGIEGFDKKIWSGRMLTVAGDPAVEFTLASHDGDQGYPGTLTIRVTYILTKTGLRVKYHATTDKDTIFNPTNHTYWNLEGHGSGDILDHVLQISADTFVATDETNIPAKEHTRSVAGTPFDFRTPTPIGLNINADDEQIRYGHGYDHHFDRRGPDTFMAKVYAPKPGRVMEMHTDRPGTQFYAGYYLPEKGKEEGMKGKDGAEYFRYQALCLESQSRPDSPNHEGDPMFPSVVLKEGETFESETDYDFSIAA